ncbi:hypothetical protein PVAP13_3NG046400 [Panicum virgatum]|uniref:Auxin-responsive protein n=1 Tax=Panicum virgatum TaxID=38727 RepID=A0A8T0TU13_PANVG|nr:hypothetical protein PVAP13_3NG046400 [Panicum virgatum]
MSPPLELDYIGLSPPEVAAAADAADDLKGTELRLGLPGSESPGRRVAAATATTLDLLPAKGDAEAKQGQGFLYVKVSMDGAPYLRKIDLKTYKNYKDLSTALEKMFSGFSNGKDGLSEYHKDGEYVLTYEDKDGDWMLVGDVPWEMFADSCRRLRIMKGSDAIGLAPRAADKSKNRN